MSLIKFLTSKTFLKQIILAVVGIVVLCFILLKWLSITTNHGEFEIVPDLKGKSMGVAQIDLNANNLRLEVLDSSNYNPDYPKFSVIEQDPIAGEEVKYNRKIYVTLNPSGFRKVRIPNLKEKTFRQAKPTLEALGFVIGEITYTDYLGENEVVRLKHKGSEIKEGDELPKTSKIDLVLGNGNRSGSN
ncbi:PASTA domain-containing protein [Bizionia argentinensis JUB59]|uniref:PASTA domain-containing protein n=1 Tax=Bizionia argentinensis JUB59 TaxID=1046627 RepID=G2EA96_9FLAO|nr:PASTA domain-containing protein [Bizionia argentinensis]EGV44700.2 PASTA domain-containing protein [Bizionia argentinensis JUB59]